MYVGRGEKSGCLPDDLDGLAPIDEHGSLRVSSPLKQQRKHPASPMRNAVVQMKSSGLSKPNDPSKMSYAAVVTKDSKHVSAEGGHSATRVKDQVPRNWTCGDLLGQGAFGSVYLGLDNDTGRLMAVKQVSLGHAGGASSAKIAEHIRSLESEVDTLKLLDHPNIVRYIGTERNAKLINIFLEFVPGGSIASLLTNFGPFKEPVVKMYTKQILLGLEYLHNNGIMHRDIKGANILVENTGLVKLADFGASKKIEDLVTIGSGANSVKGTPYWMAPEVITQTGREGFFNLSMDPITVTTSTAFRTAFSFAYETVSSTCPSEFELGDILTPTFTNIGGLSSLHVYAAPISSMSIQLTIVNNGTAAQTLTSSGGVKNLYVKVDYNRATT